jgi:ABC-2 type transport system ATP-binding protein
VIRQGKIDSLLGAAATVELRIGNLVNTLIPDIKALTGSEPEIQSQEKIVVTVSNESQIPELAKLVVNSGAELLALIPQRESLEDLFIRVVEDQNTKI